jgi:hypothetical protein
MKTNASMSEKVFNPESWKRNRSKYKILKLLAIAKPDTMTSFEWLYANAGIPHSTLAIGLKKWIAWRYIKFDGKSYRILNPGRLLINKLATKICPGAVKEWDAELRDWWNMLPPINNWNRPELKRLIEPCLFHRPAAHPGPSIYRKGGCYWFANRKMYLLSAPFRHYIRKPVTKRKKLGENWTYCTEIGEIISYVSARAPNLHYSVTEELVHESVRGF